jgi:hypothetical protein
MVERNGPREEDTRTRLPRCDTLSRNAQGLILIRGFLKLKERKEKREESWVCGEPGGVHESSVGIWLERLAERERIQQSIINLPKGLSLQIGSQY